MERDSKGRVKKGVILNPKGRPKGAVNKTTAQMKTMIKNFVQQELENIDVLLSEMNATERLYIISRFLPYVIPKERQSEANQAERQLTVVVEEKKEKLDVSLCTDDELHAIIEYHKIVKRVSEAQKQLKKGNDE